MGIFVCNSMARWAKLLLIVISACIVYLPEQQTDMLCAGVVLLAVASLVPLIDAQAGVWATVYNAL